MKQVEEGGGGGGSNPGEQGGGEVRVPKKVLSGCLGQVDFLAQ